MDDSSHSILSPFLVTIIGIMSAALTLTIYHCVVARCRNRQGRPGGPRARSLSDERASAGVEEVSDTRLVPPACTYGKEEGMVGGRESTCPVCLCDFKDGEQVRLLPECAHYYHVSCIDMWLRTHTSCPMCRADATPPVTRPASGWQPPGSGGTPGVVE